MQIIVDDRLLRAADRLYDAVNDAIRAVDSTVTCKPQRLRAMRARLQRAKDGYDAAMTAEPAEVEHVA